MCRALFAGRGYLGIAIALMTFIAWAAGLAPTLGLPALAPRRQARRAESRPPLGLRGRGASTGPGDQDPAPPEGGGGPLVFGSGMVT